MQTKISIEKLGNRAIIPHTGQKIGKIQHATKKLGESSFNTGKKVIYFLSPQRTQKIEDFSSKGTLMLSLSKYKSLFTRKKGDFPPIFEGILKSS